MAPIVLRVFLAAVAITLARPAAAAEPTVPAPTTVLPLAAQRLLVLDWRATRLEPIFHGLRQTQYDVLRAHIDRVSDLLDAAAEPSPEQATLLRAVATGTALGELTLEVMLLDDLARGQHIRIQRPVNLVLSEFLWPAIHALGQDPDWIDRPSTTTEPFASEAARILWHARAHRQAIGVVIRVALILLI